MDRKNSPRIGCVVMAAGTEQARLLRPYDGKALIARALDAVPPELAGDTVVVASGEGVAELARARGFAVLPNEQPARGISRTIRLGTQAMADCAGILYMVADQPLLRAGTVRRVVDAWRANPDCIAAAAHNGKRGSPCLFPARFFPEMCALEADRGGSSVIRRHEDALLLVEAGERELFDCDTKQALEILKGNA